MQPTFADLGVPAPLVAALTRAGIGEPFAVQAATIPDALAGRDICGRAPTGSGKTIAFGIPLLARCGKAKPSRPTALVLSPTRELAEQIRTALVAPARTVDRWVAAVYGGVGYGAQVRELRKGVDVLVACPGRLEDLINQRDVSLEDVSIVVVDEADQMADMGFLPAVKRLLDQTRTNRQTLLFSATLDGDIATLTARYQKDPVRHEIGEAEPDVDSMAHHFWNIEHTDRVDHARDVITAAGATVVFCRTRHGADRLTGQLEKAGVAAAAIHGGRNQSQRTRALEAFTRGRVQALVATDVAARGIHVDGVACVLHFDLPEDDKTYLHRSGRTARAGATGTVVSFVRPNQRGELKVLQKALGLPLGAGHVDVRLLGGDPGAVAAAQERARTRALAGPSEQDTPSPAPRRERSRNSNLYPAGDARTGQWEVVNSHRLGRGPARAEPGPDRRPTGDAQTPEWRPPRDGRPSGSGRPGQTRDTRGTGKPAGRSGGHRKGGPQARQGGTRRRG